MAACNRQETPDQETHKDPDDDIESNHLFFN